MATVLDIITDSLQDLGASAVGEVPSAAEAQGAFRRLNRMLQTWNTESLMVYNIQQETFSYVADQATYTIGTGGNFNTARPVRIEAAYNRNNQTIDLPIQVVTNYEEYAAIIAKAIETTLPVVMYADGSFPRQNLTFWPVPSDTTYTPVLWMWKPLTAFATLSEEVSLPPGYERALVSNLAIECAPSYGRSVSSELALVATESKAQIKRINTQVDTMRFSIALTKNRSIYSYADFLAGN